MPKSVLSTGSWYKVSLKEEGIYKVDYHLLATLGVNMTNLSASSIRLFGNGGEMLPEKVSVQVPDDLQENAIQMMDGGDGQFNQGDYFLFYAAGPHRWLKDEATRLFTYHQNLYNGESFYFITIGGTGKRITASRTDQAANVVVSSFDERYHFESDAVNLLSSGKNWYGDNFSNAPGQVNRRLFMLPLDHHLVPNTEIVFRSNCISRSVGAGSSFTVRQNLLKVLQHDFEGVSAGSYEQLARTSALTTTFLPVSPMTIEYSYSAGAIDAEGWLDWFEVFSRSKLEITERKPLFFRDWKSVRDSAIAAFNIKGATSSTRVWEITDPLHPVLREGNYLGNEFTFQNDCSILREYVAFDGGFITPQPIGKVKNQDLHQVSDVQLLIVTHPLFLTEARRVANFHRDQDNLASLIVTTGEIYNEFSSGSADPVAIRNFVKMFYDRAGSDSSKKPAYLLLFGDASYDYKNKLKGNGSMVPAYETAISLDPLASYTSDDFYGFLDDGEDINDPNITNLLDIGIGRIPSLTLSQAKAYVDKLISYKDSSTLGSWRNQLTFIADDEDFNLHLQDAEIVSNAAAAVNDIMVVNKIYLDAFKQESRSSGNRYPVANKAIKEQVEKGNLILNYNGHGGFRRLAEEVVLDQDILNTWYNPQQLPLFITATCDFAPYDNPAIYSLGEDMLLRRASGAIALMTTTRLVFAYSNRIMNQRYLETALTRKADGSYRSLGEAVKLAKNKIYSSSSDIINNRKFTLLGDPALTLNFPRYQIATTEINGRRPGAVPDTIKAFGQVLIKGEIRDGQGKPIPGFHGNIEVKVFDKPESVVTLANDASSLKQNFEVQEKLLFKGNATVTSGQFSVQFIVPKDIDYKNGKGLITYYAENGVTDASGSFSHLIISGSNTPLADISGPDMQGWMENYSFNSGQTVSDHPLLLLKIRDSSGINVTGRGGGHEITATLDGDVANRFILNDWFRLEKDSYQQGEVRFRLPSLSEGKHELRLKSWDNANNSSELMLLFNVKKAPHLIDDLVNYPNPVSGITRFCISHKKPGEMLHVMVNIFNPQGQLIKSIQRTINSPRDRSCEIEWDGLDSRGRKLKPGVYIYNIELQSADGTKDNKSKKLIVI